MTTEAVILQRLRQAANKLALKIAAEPSEAVAAQLRVEHTALRKALCRLARTLGGERGRA